MTSCLPDDICKDVSNHLALRLETKDPLVAIFAAVVDRCLAGFTEKSANINNDTPTTVTIELTLERSVELNTTPRLTSMSLDNALVVCDLPRYW